MRTRILVFVTLCVFAAGNLAAQGGRTKNAAGDLPALLMSPGSLSGTPSGTALSVNNLITYINANGQGNSRPGDVSGLTFPRGTATAVYVDGMIWGGRAYLDEGHTSFPTQRTRVGGQTYNPGTAAGWVNGFGASATPVSPADPRARVYRCRRDYRSLGTADLTADAAATLGIAPATVTQADRDELLAQYHTDWIEWPVDLGAPYIERNGIPGYQPPPLLNENPDSGSVFPVDSLLAGRYDEPGIARDSLAPPADQVVWAVFNDLDAGVAGGMAKSSPIGLEGQLTLWAYKGADALGNVCYKRLRLINKGGVDVGGGTLGSLYLDSVYIGQWSDPDLGASGDDLVGCDTTLNMGFVYNGAAVDQEYSSFALPPPAMGYALLQGPVVPGLPSDSASYALQWFKGARNLPMTAFVYSAAGSAVGEPSGSTYESSLQWYRMLKGYRPDPTGVAERFYAFPPAIPAGPITLSGTPENNAGFVDGMSTVYSLQPGDRRLLLASGPFTMAPGDTQEIVLAIMGGLGSDRKSSVNVLRSTAAAARGAFLALHTVVTEIRDDASPAKPSGVHLSQNYPNPFNPSTTIRLTIVNRQLTIVKVFDVLGREVATLLNEVKDPGTYTVRFDGSRLASGVYFYRLQAGGFVATRRLLLLR